MVLYKTIRELNRAHQLGYMHLDIKPSNIVVEAY